MGRKRKTYAAIAAVVVLAVCIAVWPGDGREKGSSGQRLAEPDVSPETNAVLEAFARQHDLRLSDWPDELVELLERNPDAEEFVLNYPLKKKERFEIDLSDLTGGGVPLLFQWDERWGYTTYGDGLMGLTGCGPTCLSMVCIGLLDDPSLDPATVAQFAQKHGYYVRDKGSSWTLISQGGGQLGLQVEELPLDENRIRKSLEAGKPVICAMGPGEFTTSGHFIVLTQYEDGQFHVNDPNSKTRSERLWSYEDIQDQIKNLWACSRA